MAASYEDDRNWRFIISGLAVLIPVLVFQNCSKYSMVNSDNAATGNMSQSAAEEKKQNLLLVSSSPDIGASDSSIFTTLADGSNKTVLTTADGSPSWTPDGRI